MNRPTPKQSWGTEFFSGKRARITWGFDKLYSRRSRSLPNLWKSIGSHWRPKFLRHISKRYFSYLVEKRTLLFTEIAKVALAAHCALA